MRCFHEILAQSNRNVLILGCPAGLAQLTGKISPCSKVDGCLKISGQEFSQELQKVFRLLAAVFDELLMFGGRESAGVDRRYLVCKGFLSVHAK